MQFFFNQLQSLDKMQQVKTTKCSRKNATFIKQHLITHKNKRGNTGGIKSSISQNGKMHFRKDKRLENKKGKKRKNKTQPHLTLQNVSQNTNNISEET